MAKVKYAPGQHPNSRKNLKPIQKGETRNPNGRPRNELSLTNCARQKLSEPCPYAAGKTWLEYLVDRWLAHAVDNPAYFKELMERLEGKVVQPIGGENGQPVKVEIIVDNESARNLTKSILKGERTE